MTQIIGIGTDIVLIERIARIRAQQGKRFLDRIFTPNEQAFADRLSVNAQNAFYAKRFAAKEAFVKALGCGIGSNAFWTDIEIIRTNSGAPAFHISGRAAQTLHNKAPHATVHLSLSDDSYATAFVVIEA